MNHEIQGRKFNTGDIVLFSGRCKVGNLIKVSTLCRWTHTGIIINDDPNHDEPLVYESSLCTGLKGLDVGDYTEGVQVTRLKDRIAVYNGAVAVRHVINPCYQQRHRLRLYRTEMTGKPFEESMIDLFSAALVFRWLRLFKPNRKHTDSLSSLFCSEHIIEAVKALGWLPETMDSSNVTPRFFAKNKKFLNGVTYSDIQLLKTK